MGPVDLSLLDRDVVDAACLYYRAVRQFRIAVAQGVAAGFVAWAMVTRYGETPSYVGAFPFGLAWFVAALLFVTYAGVYYGAIYLKRSVAFAWLISARSLSGAPDLPHDVALRDWVRRVAAERKA